MDYISAQGREVGRVLAIDRDDGTNGQVSYSLLYTVDVNSKFTVDGATGAVVTGSVLDFEEIQQHILYVKAEDKGRPLCTCKSNKLTYTALRHRSFPRYVMSANGC